MTCAKIKPGQKKGLNNMSTSAHYKPTLMAYWRGDIDSNTNWQKDNSVNGLTPIGKDLRDNYENQFGKKYVVTLFCFQFCLGAGSVW